MKLIRRLIISFKMSSETSGNVFGKLLRQTLVFLLENHVVRFIVTLLMSFAYDTYSYGKLIILLLNHPSSNGRRLTKREKEWSEYMLFIVLQMSPL